MSIRQFLFGFGLGIVLLVPLGWFLFRKRRYDWFGAHLVDLPVSRLRYLLAARFFRMASVGFLVDAVLGGSMSRPLVLLFAFLFGLCGPAVLLLRHRPPLQRLLVVLPIVFALYGIAIVHWHGNDAPPSAAASAFRFDVYLIFFTALASALVTAKHINREGTRQLRAETELEAAKAVQQVLIPSEKLVLPGFRIDSAYQPAGQVGGDFFQILPAPRGGVLAMIGDVSGKGMPAAMTVSVLLGTFRAAAQYTTNPGEILEAANRSVLSRSQDGFTTCLVLRIDQDGTMSLANAGHLPPYCDGEELDIESGLPLGLQPQSKYQESKLALKPGVQLTLLTDGVVEARSASGELFGFARAQTWSRKSAGQIVEAAREFGQEDDITVLTLALESAIHATLPGERMETSV